MSKKPKLTVVVDKENPQADGRRQRSQRSREKILRAYWELMLGGDMEPSAAAIAEHAGVGLRSVFRHFDDLDTLLLELMSLCYDEVTPQFLKPLKSINWKDQILELVERNVEIWERIKVPHTAGELGRFKSQILMDDYKRSRNLEISGIRAILPKDINNYDNVLFALDSTLSFSTMRRLREDRKLSIPKVKNIMSLLVKSILDTID
jgi:AcrR family transcriptional regulator